MWQPKLEARVLQELARAARPTACSRWAPAAATSPRCSRTAPRRSARWRSTPRSRRSAARNLERHGADNVTLEIGDAARGWARHAPYDVIVLTGSTPVLPQALLEQLAPGGRLFAVVGEAPAMSGAPRDAAPRPARSHSVDLFETVIAPLANAEQPSRFRF